VPVGSDPGIGANASEPKAPATTARRQATKAAVFAGLSFTALMVGALLGQVEDRAVAGRLDAATAGERIIVYVAALAVLAFGVTAVRLGGSAIKLAGAQLADGRAASLASIFSLLGYVAVALAALSALRINLSGLLVGGAISGVVLGIAAQQTLGNFFAGIVLLSSGSVRVGQEVFLKSGPLGEHVGRVVEMTLMHVQLLTDEGLVALPNAGVLAGAIRVGEAPAGNGDEAGGDEGEASGGE
jgi:small-conductance mechanosensitive channel